MNRYALSTLWLFTFVVCGVGFASVYGKADHRIVDLEQRHPNSLPSLSRSEWFSGEFAKGFEAWLADRVVWRQQALDAQEWLRSARGLNSDSERVIAVAQSNPYALEPEVHEPAGHADAQEDLVGFDGLETPSFPRGIPQGSVVRSSAETSTPASTGIQPTAAVDTSFRSNPKARPVKSRLNKGILIAGDRALQLFGSSAKSARWYAKSVSKIADGLVPNYRVFSVVAPTAISYYAPKKYEKAAKSERAFLRALNEALSTSIVPIDALAALESHRDAYIFFRTDHHWTARGAYWVYAAFAREAGVQIVPLDDARKLKAQSFHGSLYGITRARELRKNADTLELWEPRAEYESRILHRGARKTRKGGAFIQPKWKNYLVFMGGDYPMVTANTNTENGRHLLMVKNSFGNAIAPFLLDSFETVVVIDYRHFEGNLAQVAAQYGITDILIQNVSLTATSGYHLRRLRKVFRPLITKVQAQRRSLLKKQ